MSIWQYFCRTQCDIYKTSMHIVIACCVLILFLQTSACWLLDQTHTHTTFVLYLEHQLIPPHSVLLPITAVSPPPHTLGPARKWVMYVCAFWVCVCVSVPYSYIMDIYNMHCECGGISMFCTLVSMHGCIWVYMCMHHGVGGMHVHVCVWVFAVLWSFSPVATSFKLWSYSNFHIPEVIMRLPIGWRQCVSWVTIGG